MDTALKVLFAPLQLLSHPEHAYVIASLFAILFVASLVRSGKFQPRRHLVMLFAVVAWVLFGLNEAQAQANGWNIRVDLLITWPVVLAVSIAAAWTGFRNGGGRALAGQNAEKSPNEAHLP